MHQNLFEVDRLQTRSVIVIGRAFIFVRGAPEPGSDRPAVLDELTPNFRGEPLRNYFLIRLLHRMQKGESLSRRNRINVTRILSVHLQNLRGLTRQFVK